MKSKIHEHQKNNKYLVSKKFVFSAVAMIAFSGGLFAEDNGKIAEIREVDRYCYDRAILVGELATLDNPNLTDAQISWYMNVSIAHCMGYSYGEIYQNYPYPN